MIQRTCMILFYVRYYSFINVPTYSYIFYLFIICYKLSAINIRIVASCALYQSIIRAVAFNIWPLYYLLQYPPRKIIMVSNNLVLFFVVFKFISIVIGNFGNIIIIIYTIFVSKEKTGTIILGWQWQMFSCAYNFIQYE